MESSSFWNPESTVLESGIQYPESESTAWNPESKTVLDSFTWGELYVCKIREKRQNTVNVTTVRIVLTFLILLLMNLKKTIKFISSAELSSEHLERRRLL